MRNEGRTMAGKRIMVVDDEAIIREGMTRILSGSDYSVETYANGYLALEKLQESSFDLLITDLKMPGMGGMEVLQGITVLQPEMPVIILTGYS